MFHGGVKRKERPASFSNSQCWVLWVSCLAKDKSAGRISAHHLTAVASTAFSGSAIQMSRVIDAVTGHTVATFVAVEAFFLLETLKQIEV
jgi:hypothetical protein